MSRKKMKVNRKMNLIIFLFVLLCVFSLTIVYAVLNTSLNISGNAEINSSEWSFKIEKADLSHLDGIMDYHDNYLYSGDGVVTKDATISGTTISNYEVSLTKPDDSITLVYAITNTGTLPAEYLSINCSTGSISSDIGNSADIKWGEENVIYEGFLFNELGNEMYDVGYIICPGETVTLTANIFIDITVNSLPSSKLMISDLKTEVVFGQTSDSNGVCNND